MSPESLILVGVFDGFSWIRCEGKGSFLNSPTIKAFAEERISLGERCLTIDLGGCTGMDSTFMGTLAGVANRLSSQNQGTLQIADAGTRNRRSLEDLGLDFLLEIEPDQAMWKNQMDQIRTDLSSPQPPPALGQIQRTAHVLEAHQVLADANDKNAKTFSNVVTILGNELTEKQRLAQNSKSH